MSALAEILAHPAIWRGNRPVAVSLPSLSTGFPVLDAALPGGGWPTAALIEILPQHEGIGELRILGHALSRLTDQGRFLVWIAPPYLPYAPALRSAGIDLARLIIVKTHSPRETLWATEQALRSNACAAVLAWPLTANYAELRRLQIAAEGNPVLAVLFRSPRVARETTPAPLRLSLATAHGELAVRVLKRRGAPLVNPILLRAPAVAGRRVQWPLFAHHAVDRTRLPSPAARIVPASVNAV
ncbi:MAG: translesion DNA synthesis-associated protein ImuA, partial [Pseudomonadota bacterium]